MVKQLPSITSTVGTRDTLGSAVDVFMHQSVRTRLKAILFASPVRWNFSVAQALSGHSLCLCYGRSAVGGA